MEKSFPTIVIPIHKRRKSLNRLLHSLKHARYPDDREIDLLFSIEGVADYQVKSLVNHFYWPYGQKICKEQDHYLGLENHLMQCGRYSIELNHPVVIFEDDLFAAPYFYDWVLETLKFCDENNQIGGVSLYSFDRNLPFGYPFKSQEVSSAFYLQKVSTWGQVFTPQQWQNFENWCQASPDLGRINPRAPLKIRQYPDDNWEKLFNYYLIDTDRYFLYPPWSYSTNFGELGEHVKRHSEENAFQVPLQLGGTVPEIESIEEPNGVYDAFFELLPSRMKRLNTDLEPYNFEVDLYGSKPLPEIDKPYVLSCKKAVNPEMTFGRNLKPHELNMAYGIEGSDFYLAKKENFKDNPIDRWRRELRTHYFHYPDLSLNKTLKLKFFEIISRIFPSLIRK